MNPRFIIELIVRARNEVAGTMNKVTGDIDKSTKAQDRGTASEKRRAEATATTTRKVEDAVKRFESYTKELERGGKSTDEAVKHLQGFRREFDRLGNSVKPGTEAADQLYKMGRAADTLARQIKQANDEAARSEAARAAAVEAASQRVIAARRREAQDFIKSVRDELSEDTRRAKEFERNLERGERPYRMRILAIQHGREETERASQADAISADEVVRQQRQIQAELAKTIRLRQNARSQAEREAANTKISAQAQSLRDLGVPDRNVRRALKDAYTDQDVDTAITKRQRLIHDLAEEQRRLNDQPEPKRSWLSKFFSVDTGRIDAINTRIQDFERSADRGGFSAVRFAGNLRGMVIVGVLAFFQQLIGIGVSVGATLASIAASAIQAGAALGGALVAGAAQAIPIIGLLGAAWGRVGAVFDAVKQAQKARMTAANDEVAQADKQRSAADAIRSAQEALANAQRSATAAQEGLTKARFEARRQIEDLVQAEREAQLQAEASTLAQREALQTFNRSLASGDVDRAASNALQVRQSSGQVLTSGIASARATFDATRAVRGGVEGMDSVVAARRSIADAARGIASARRQLQEARRDAGEATKDVSSAQKQLQALLGQLSPSERRLFESIERVEARYKKVFTGRGGVLESIIDSFTYGVNKANDLLKDKRLIGEAKNLSGAIGTELRKAFDFATSEKQRGFFVTMSEEARHNLPTVTSILEHLVGLIDHIALAGRGALRRLLGFLDDLIGKADEASGSNSGMAKLERFFSTGEKYAESWVHLGGAIARLFLAVIGQSADQGNKAIEDLTNNINKATDWINTHQKDVHQFFEDARESTGEVFKMVWALTKAIFSLFHPDQVNSFSHAIQETLIPTLMNILTVTGAISKIFLDIAASPGGSAIITFLLTMIGLKATIGPLVVGIARLAVFFGTLFQSMRVVNGGLVAIRIASGPLGLAIAAIASAVLILTGRMDKLGDMLEGLVPIVGALAGAFIAKKGLGGAITSISGMLGGLGSKLPGLKGIFGKIFGRGGAAAGEAAEGGAALGGAVGVGARTAIFGALKKAGWIGLGISAGQGIVSGFKHNSVRAGVQDFFHSISFGLVKSVDQAGDEAAKRLIKKLSRGASIDIRTPDQVSLDTPAQATERQPVIRPTGGRGAGVNPVLVNRQNRGGADRGDFEALARANPKIAKAIELYQKLREKIIAARGMGKPLTDSLIAEISRFTSTAPEELKSAAGQMADSLGIFVDKAGSAEDAIKRLSDAVRSASDMGIPARQIGEFNKVLKGTSQRFRDLQDTGTDSLNNIKRVTDTNTATIKELLGSRSAAGKAALAANYRNAADAVQKSMDKAGKTTREGLEKIRRLMKAALRVYGLSDEQAGNYLDNKTGDTAGKGSVGLPGSGQGGHTGGFIGLEGERGGDGTGPFINGKATGRGEAVLTSGHQSIVNSVFGWAKRNGGPAVGSLRNLFNSYKSQHGPANGFRGLAMGGYVQQAAANGGGEHLTSAARSFANRMFKLGYSVTSAFRPGDPRQHGQGQALDFGNSVNNLSSLWRLLFPIRAKFNQLLGPQGLYNGLERFYNADLQADHNDHIHIGFLGAVKAALKGATNSGAASAAGEVAKAIKHIKAPKVKGDSALSGIVRGVFKQATKAANSRLDELAGTGGDGAPVGGGAVGTAQVRKWATQALKITKRFSKGNLNALVARIMFESGGNPNAINLTDSNAKAGHPSKGLGQTIDSTFQSYRLKRLPNNIYDPIANLVASIRYMIARYGHIVGETGKGYETGGAVKQTGKALLHGGEHVWTASEVAAAGGQQVMYALRKLLSGVARGAVASPTATGSAPQGSASIKGPYTEPATHGIDVPGLLGEVTRAQRVIASLKSSTISKKFTDRLSKSFQQLLGDGGLLDQMDEAVQRLAGRLEVNLKRATYKLNGAGDAIRGLDDVGVADQTIKNLKDVYGALNKEQLAIQGSLSDVAARLKSGSLTKGERAYLTGAKRNLEKRLREVQSSIADNVESQYEAIEQQVQSRVDKANNKATIATGKLDIIQRMRDLTGGSILSFLGAQNNEAIGQQRADVLGGQADQLQKAADFARKRGHSDTADEIVRQIEDLRISAMEAVRDGISKDVDEVNRQAGRTTAALDIRGRIAQALGRVGDLSSIVQDRLEATGNQINALAAKQSEASAKGFYDLAETIGDQIAELQASITELAIQQLQDAIDQVNKTATRATAGFDLRDRLSSLRQAAGDYAGAFAERAQTLSGRGDTLAQQRNAIYGLLGQAQQQGNQSAVADLTDQIAELDVSIAENTTAIKSNTVQARQAAIDAINNRGSFLGGVFGGLQNIVTTLGQISGNVDTNTLRTLLGQQGTTLAQTGSGLAGQLLSGYGIDLRGQSPSQLVTSLSGLNYDQIESGMSEEQRQQFEALINSIIENTSAQVSNTEQLEQLNSPNTQTFTSTAWTWFRNAIFNGSGGLLGQYQNPSLGIAAGMTSALVSVPSPATMAVADANQQNSSSGDFSAEINVTEQVEDADPEVIATRLLNRYRTTSRTS